MVYIHTAFFIYPSVSAKNRPGFRNRKPGWFFVLTEGQMKNAA